MKYEMKFLLGFLKVFAFSLLIVSCSTDDDAPVPEAEFNNTSFKTDSATTTFIDSDGKVTVSVSGTYNDGNTNSVNRGFVFGKTEKTLVSENNIVTAIGPNDATKGTIKGLDLNTVYYIRGFIKNDEGDYFYGNEIKVTTSKPQGNKTVKLKINPPSEIGTSSRSTNVSVIIDEMTIEAPIEVGVQYSTKSNFTDVKAIRSDSQIVLGGHDVRALLLSPSTKYYFRPYVKYRDNSIIVAEDANVLTITTKDLNVGDVYPITEEDFSSLINGNYIVLEIDQDKREALLVGIKDVVSNDGWKETQTKSGLEVRNPTVAEIKKMKALNMVGNGGNGFFWARFTDFVDAELWTSAEENEDNAFTYNPVSDQTKAVAKTNKTIKSRFVGKIKF